MTQMLDQLMPASARNAANVRNIVESHALERNKIQYRAPLLKPPGTLAGTNQITGDINGPNVDIGIGGDPNDSGNYPPERPNNANPDNLGGDEMLPPEQINLQQLEEWARNFNPEDVQPIIPDIPGFG